MCFPIAVTVTMPRDSGSLGGSHQSGGGSGGGGWGGRGYHHHHNEGEDCKGCLECCICFSSIIGFLTCILTKTYKQRLVVLWCWTVVIVLTVTMILIFGVYRNNQIDVSPSDMRIVTRAGQSTFCQTVMITSDQFESEYSAYLLRIPPNILPGFVRDVHEITSSVSSQSYRYWGFYLIAGSIMNLSICPTSTSSHVRSITMYIIKDENNMHKWKNDNNCNDCYISSHSYSILLDCYEPIRLTYEIPNTSEYYIMFANIAAEYYYYTHVDLEMTFTMMRTKYDVSTDLEKVCTSSNIWSTCYFEMNAFSSQTIIYEAHRNMTSYDATSRIECGTRVSTYIIISVIPIALIFCITMLVTKRMHQHATYHEGPSIPTVSGSIQHSQRAPLVSSELPPSYDSLQIDTSGRSVMFEQPVYQGPGRLPEYPPPSYDSVVSPLSQS